MRKVKIFGDSTIDLNKELYEQNNISIVPLTIIMGGTSYKDGENITPAQIYRHFETKNELPKTAAINSETYKEYWMPFLDQGYDIVHFNISSDMSASHINACKAAEELGLDRIFVVDTKNLSSGSGLLVLYACDLVKQGLGAQDIKNRCMARTDAVQASFIIDRLNYLYKGGRCSSLALIAATALTLKPSIRVKNGKMLTGKKYIGKLASVAEKYVKDTLKEFNNPDYTRVFITYTETPLDIVDNLVNIVKALPFKSVLVTEASCTISSHCGPHTLGILYINDGGVDNTK